MDEGRVVAALSALPYSYSNGVLTVIDDQASSHIALRKLTLQSRYSVSVSFHRNRVTLKYGSVSTYCSILRDVLSLPALPTDHFLYYSKPAFDPISSPRPCFALPTAPSVDAVSPDRVPAMRRFLSRPPSRYRPFQSRVGFHISSRPPPFFRELSNTLLKCYQPVADRPDSDDRPVGPSAPIAVEVPARTGPLHIEFRPAPPPPPKSSGAVRISNGEIRSSDGRKVVVVRGQELVMTGDPAVMAEARAALFRLLGLRPDSPVSSFVFQ
jgi:hypothetical protein